MCYFSLTISSDSHKPAQKCQPFWVVFHQPSGINPHSLQTWELFKRELPPLKKDPLLQSRPFTCLLMTWQTLPPLLLSHTWTLPLCCQEPWPNWVFTLPSTLSTLHQECWILQSSEKNIIQWPEVFKNYYKITRACKILLPFWVWMSFLKKINWLCPEPEKSRNSYLNHSSCLKSSLVLQENSLT
jgi:hypothetical protein